MKVKMIRKCIAILLYLLLMAWILPFDIALLFDLKQIGLVIIGTVIFYLPHISGGVRRPDRNLVGQSALLGGMTTCFVLLFVTLSGAVGQEHLYMGIALAFRPLFYGFCIWMIFAGEYGEGGKTEEDQERVTQEKGREILQEMGLTRRETEVSLLVLQGLTNREIAQELYISETTVKKHISNVFAKLEIGAREDLRRKVKERGRNRDSGRIV